jgi:sodium/hydrogen exchanger 10/11
VVWSRCGAAAQLFFGILLGWGAGYITCVLLRFVYNDKLIEASIIIAFTFLTFWAGELATGASAVIAVVVMGLYVNFHKSAVSNEVLHFLHEFYEMVAHALNTVIFAIAGLKMSTFFLDYSMNVVMPDSLGGSGSIFKIGFMGIFSVLVARGVAIGVVWPVLRRLGTGCTWQEAVVLWWGGLRGSVGLALALIMFHTIYDDRQWQNGQDTIQFVDEGTQQMFDDGLLPFLDAVPKLSINALHCQLQPTMLLMMTVIVVFGTVLINGVTMAPISMRTP